ncbi:MAG: hypothetical protein ABSG75_07365 [Syntrophales bacterium]|jgi:hypothetical protein
MRFLLAFILSATLFGICPDAAVARVLVYDDVVLKGHEIMLRAETRGTFLSKGGEVVEFIVDGRSIGKNLSGRDGFAVKTFVPARTGLYKINVKSGDDKDSGILLALEKKTRIVFIDVGGSLLEGPFGEKQKPESSKAIAKIQKRFPIVYLLKGLLSAQTIKTWLKKNNFPVAPVMPWGQGEVFREIKERDLQIKAIIGGADVIESAREYKPLAFSFDSMEDAEVVENWREIEKKLK